MFMDSLQNSKGMIKVRIEESNLKDTCKYRLALGKIMRVTVQAKQNQTNSKNLPQMRRRLWCFLFLYHLFLQAQKKRHEASRFSS